MYKNLKKKEQKKFEMKKDNNVLSGEYVPKSRCHMRGTSITKIKLNVPPKEHTKNRPGEEENVFIQNAFQFI